MDRLQVLHYAGIRDPTISTEQSVRICELTRWYSEDLGDRIPGEGYRV